MNDPRAFSAGRAGPAGDPLRRLLGHGLEPPLVATLCFSRRCELPARTSAPAGRRRSKRAASP